jgi:hypothetical protein
MSGGSFLSWEEAQRLMLPPNSTMLVPPVAEPAEVPVLASNPPTPPDWLDDPSLAQAGSPSEDSSENGPLRFLANVITINALLDYALSPPPAEEEEKKEAKRLAGDPRPDMP